MKTQQPPGARLEQRWTGYPYPTIAMMNGYAFGAGLNLAMCCDMRIAQSRTSVWACRRQSSALVYHPEGLRQFIEVVGMANAPRALFHREDL
ncbi:MAG: enoyl-CoA hydratase-related protein [Desulfobacterales bacterium]|nr:enoyl-CoA hydratase-related protein [Desulfobacterales bacterium]